MTTKYKPAKWADAKAKVAELEEQVENLTKLKDHHEMTISTLTQEVDGLKESFQSESNSADALFEHTLELNDDLTVARRRILEQAREMSEKNNGHWIDGLFYGTFLGIVLGFGILAFLLKFFGHH